MAIEIEKPMQVFQGYEQLANVLQDALDQAQAGKGNQRHANGKPFLEQPIITDGRACGLAGPAFQARKKILEALNCPDEERAVQDLLGAIVYTAAMVILKEEEWQKRNEVNQGTEPWQDAISEQEAQVRAQVATASAPVNQTPVSFLKAPIIVDGQESGKGRLTCPLCGDTYLHEMGVGGGFWCESCGPGPGTARKLISLKLVTEYHKGETKIFWDVILDDNHQDFGIIAIDGKSDPSGSGYTIPPLQDGDDNPAVHIVPDKTSRATLPSGCLGRLCGRGDDDEWRPCPEDAL